MADKHPYVSGGGPLIQVIEHLRKSFPSKVNAETLKKLGYAPKNESYIINTLRFLSVIDEEGTKTDVAEKTFTLHDSASFQKEFSKMVKNAYSDLFSLHGEQSWGLDSNKLITFFRQTDHSSDIVGRRQADTFKILAGISGYGEPTVPKAKKSKEQSSSTKKAKPKGNNERPTDPRILADSQNLSRRDIGLTVRIEINLPENGSQETYDRIFKSIKENLLNG